MLDIDKRRIALNLSRQIVAANLTDEQIALSGFGDLEIIATAVRMAMRQIVCNEWQKTEGHPHDVSLVIGRILNRIDNNQPSLPGLENRVPVDQGEAIKALEMRVAALEKVHVHPADRMAEKLPTLCVRVRDNTFSGSAVVIEEDDGRFVRMVEGGKGRNNMTRDDAISFGRDWASQNGYTFRND